uniref:Uncharacterized protein n=1 Tax=Rhizophora mucronata TaxID=61149 RepID=A0A2P2Q2A8_RHIMU
MTLDRRAACAAPIHEIGHAAFSKFSQSLKLR